MWTRNGCELPWAYEPLIDEPAFRSLVGTL